MYQKLYVFDLNEIITINDQSSTLLGWELDVQVSMGLMLFVVSIPDDQRGKVVGLLGKSIFRSGLFFL